MVGELSFIWQLRSSLSVPLSIEHALLQGYAEADIISKW